MPERSDFLILRRDFWVNSGDSVAVVSTQSMPSQETTVAVPYQLNIDGLFSWAYTHFFGSSAGLDTLYQHISTWWYIFSIASFAFSALLLIGIIYALIRFAELGAIQQASLLEAERVYREMHKSTGENTKWQQVLTHGSSDNPNDWRLAIIEADIMLDELLESLGYVGASIGDKLKTAQPESFRSIEDAWSAHKIRNAIAHRGSDFVLTKRVTQETITQYQHIFQEFKFI